MPRQIDPAVEARILNAAQKLWHKGGEKALTMRAIAKAARTNTPAVYRRFRNQEDILRALVQTFQRDLYNALRPSCSLQEVWQRYLDFALRRPREYELMSSGLLARMSQSRPNLEFVVQRSAEWLGGTPDDQRGLVLVLASLAHGAAMLKLSGTVPDEDFPKLRAAITSSVEILVTNSAKFRN